MTVELNKEIIELLNNDAITVLAMVDENGQPHSFQKTMRVLENGKLAYLELTESSKSYKNFTRSLWFNQKISITVVGGDGGSWRITGKPEKIIISGPFFEQNYKNIRQKLGDVDLAAICIIEPEEITNESFLYLFQEQEKQQPIFKHLDRLIK